MNRDVSRVVPTASGSGAQKLGQPVPLSNFVFDEYSGKAHPAHAYTPARFSPSSGLENGASLCSWRNTSYASGDSSFRHSASVCDTCPTERARAATGTAKTRPARPAGRVLRVIV